MATSDGFPTAAVVFFVFSYTTVFLLSVMGNVVVFCHCYSTIKRRQSLVKWFIANLAVSDLSFTGLSLLNFIAYLWTWLGGNATCKLQGFLIEACYTTSIATLAVISFERRKAVVTPFSARTNACDGVCKKLIVIWTSSLVINSPLLYAYETEIDASGSLLCTNSSFGDLGKQVYYSVHAFCVFIVPLVYMIYAQSSVFVTLRSRTFPTQDTFTTVSSDHHRKVGKILAAFSIAFAVCWTPFVTFRTLAYFQIVEEKKQYWAAGQLLIFVNTVLDPILYGIYGENVKAFLQPAFQCRRFYISPRGKRP
ncbi:QRFP-like peptide receptor [Montipora foliosa]|uniref:QRFP-like peptide receptor n=1 Tax=Montipora foliosa TaxID=591990 RepID=UPI0035F13CD4